MIFWQMQTLVTLDDDWSVDSSQSVPTDGVLETSSDIRLDEDVNNFSGRFTRTIPYMTLTRFIDDCPIDIVQACSGLLSPNDHSGFGSRLSSSCTNECSGGFRVCDWGAMGGVPGGCTLTDGARGFGGSGPRKFFAKTTWLGHWLAPAPPWSATEWMFWVKCLWHDVYFYCIVTTQLRYIESTSCCR
jgi:hypothetical protein